MPAGGEETEVHRAQEREWGEGGERRRGEERREVGVYSERRFAVLYDLNFSPSPLLSCLIMPSASKLSVFGERHGVELTSDINGWACAREGVH